MSSMNEKLDQAIESMNQAIIPVSSETVINKEVTEDEPKKIGRPTKMTDQMQKKVIKLTEELFFIRAIAGKAGVSVDTIEREIRGRSDENRKGNEDFALSFMHAQNKFIAYHQRKMMQYAKDKRTKDWRAEAHILALTDKEYSERKYLTEAVANQDAKIFMQINAEKLTIAQEEGKIMLSGQNKSESISLRLFQPDKKAKPERVINKGENGSSPSSE